LQWRFAFRRRGTAAPLQGRVVTRNPSHECEAVDPTVPTRISD
jgi:hypothetical protein